MAGIKDQMKMVRELQKAQKELKKEIIEVVERCCFSIEKRWEKIAMFTEKGRKSIEI